jgi:hypothetical protein
MMVDTQSSSEAATQSAQDPSQCADKPIKTKKKQKKKRIRAQNDDDSADEQVGDAAAAASSITSPTNQPVRKSTRVRKSSQVKQEIERDKAEMEKLKQDEQWQADDDDFD